MEMESRIKQVPSSSSCGRWPVAVAIDDYLVSW
jgi:hypothetical protein